MYYLGQILYSKKLMEPVLFAGVDSEDKAVFYNKDLEVVDLNLGEVSQIINTTTEKIARGSLCSDEFLGVVKIKSEHETAAKLQLSQFNAKIALGLLRPLTNDDRK